MQLGLTFPLQRKLKLKHVPYGPLLDRKYCWDLHCITLRGQDSLLLVHCASRYAIIACGVTRFDWERLPAFAVEQLHGGLLDADIPPDIVKNYLHAAGTAQLTRTHGRREVAFLNRAWEDTMALDLAADPAAIRQPLLEQAVNGLPRRCAGFDGMDLPLAFLKRSIC